MKKYWKKNGFILAVSMILGILASVFTTGVSILLQKVVDVAVSKQVSMFGKLLVFTVIYILLLCVINFLIVSTHVLSA